MVGASDSAFDQSVKLQVKDAITACLSREMENIMDMDQARAYLQENLPKIRNLANQVLRQLGVEDTAQVSLALESFGTRVYDTFSLPAGVYEALRVVIGEGEGRNWWCVVFPSLCMSAVSSEFADVAAGAGFSDGLVAALQGRNGYQIRFFLLDWRGNVENIFFQG